MGMYRPPFPPRRRKSRIWLLPLLAIPVVLLVIVAWTSYYYSEYKPNHYMKDWFESLGTADTLDTWYSGINGKHAFLTLKQRCAPSDRCDPAPARDLSDWLGRGVAYFSEKDAADCFRNGSVHSLVHEGHEVSVECQKVFPTNWEFRVDINLYW